MSDFDGKSGEVVRSIDLNADLGEGCPNDRALLERVSSASVSCGAHAGDPMTIRQTLRDARDCGVVISAHPGYPDREGFGRRERVVTALEVEHLILEQVEALERLAQEVGASLHFLKPHGALYNQAQRQEPAARGVLGAARRLGFPVLAQPGSLVESLAPELGVPCILEGFPDRRYRPDGSLAPRSEPGAVLHYLNEIQAQVLRLVLEGRVATLCIHGDEPAAVANADRVRQILGRNGIAIKSFVPGG